MGPNLLSVIIPTFNPGNELEQCLETLSLQLDEILEIIVVDDGSATPLQLQPYPKTRLLRHEVNKGPSAARNTGMQAAQSHFLCFIDSDVIINPPMLKNVLTLLQNSTHPKLALTCALHQLRIKEGLNFITSYKEIYMNQIFSQQKKSIDFLYGGFSAFTKPEGQQWPEHVRFGEDTFMGQLLFESGYHIQMLGMCEIRHLKNYSLISFFRHSFLIAFHFTQSLLVKKTSCLHHSHASGRQLASIATSFLILLAMVFLSWQVALVFVFAWLVLNKSFFISLKKNMPHHQTLLGIGITYLDQLTKGFAIFCGLFFFGLLHHVTKRKLSHSEIEYRGNK